MAALENLLRAEERWAEVIDVKMRPGRGLRESPAEKVREYLEVAAALGAPGRREGPRHARRTRRSSSSSRRTTQAFLGARGARTARPAGASRSSSSTSRGSRSREEVSDKTDHPPQGGPGLRGAARGQAPGVRRAAHGVRDGLRRHGRRSATSSAWRRRRTAGPSSCRRSTAGCSSRRTPAPEDHALPAPRQVVRGGPRPPEYAQPYYQQILVARPEQRRGAPPDGELLQEGTASGSSRAQMLTSALNVAVADVDRKEVLTELGEVLEKHMNEVEQGLGFYKRALDVDPLHLPALEALERIYDGSRSVERSRGRSSPARRKPLTEPEQIAATKLRTGGLYESELSQIEKAGAVYREVLEIDASNLLAMRGLERVYTPRTSGPISCASSRCSSTSSPPSASASTCCSRSPRPPGGAVPEARSVGRRASSRWSRSTRHHELALEAPGALLSPPAPVARSHQHLRSPHQRDARSAEEDRALGARRPRSTRRRSRTSTARSTRTSTSSIIQDTQHPGPGGAREALREAGRLGEGHRVHDARRRPDGRRQAARRDVLRIGQQLDEKLGDRVPAAGALRDGARSRSVTHVPTLAALRVIAIDVGRLGPGGALPRPGADEHRRAPRQGASSSSSSASSGTTCSASTRSRCRRTRWRSRAIRDNEDAAMPLLNEYVSTERWAQAEPLAEMLVRKSGKRDRSEQHRLQDTFGQGPRAALGKDEAALKAYTGRAQPRSDRPGDDPGPRGRAASSSATGRAR